MCSNPCVPDLRYVLLSRIAARMPINRECASLVVDTAEPLANFQFQLRGQWSWPCFLNRGQNLVLLKSFEWMQKSPRVLRNSRATTKEASLAGPDWLIQLIDLLQGDSSTCTAKEAVLRTGRNNSAREKSSSRMRAKLHGYGAAARCQRGQRMWCVGWGQGQACGTFRSTTTSSWKEKNGLLSHSCMIRASNNAIEILWCTWEVSKPS